MRKLCSFLLFFVLICTSSNANPVDVRQAQKAAVSYLSAVKQASSPQSRCRLAYSKADVDDTDPLLYVFAVQNGFVVVAGDDAVRPILGYSVNATFDPGNLPSNMVAYLDELSRQIKNVRQQQGAADRQTRSEWKALLADTVNVQVFQQNGSRTAVSPLLSTKWGQGYYFNRYCPEDESGHAVTGCVATALAQIVKYWESPANGFGKHTYTPSQYGTLSVDFGAANYQYSLMPDSLDYNTPQAQIDEVSKLMYHLGVALSADYGANATYGYDVAARAAMINHFGFNPYAGLAERNFYTDARWMDSLWISMLKGEIDLGRPVYYSASGSSGGHAFVCDGYDASDYFHINWGWQGYCDGYFTLDNLSAAGYTFNNQHCAMFDLYPVSSPERRIVCNIHGTTEMKVDSVAYIAHTLGYNTAYQTNNYSNVFLNTMILTPQNAGERIMIEFSEQSYPQRFTVYDGTEDAGTVLFSNDDNTGGSYLSSSDTVTIVYNGSWKNNGFLLKATTVSCIPVVYNFDCTERTETSATLSWDMLNAASGADNPRQGQLEYGLRGFTRGSGTVLDADGTSIALNGLLPDTEYEAYLTYQCNGGGVNTVGPLHFKTNPYVECFDAIGEDSRTIDYYPFHTSYRLSQQLFTAEELAAAGIVAGSSLASLSFECSVSCDQAQQFDNVTVYLGNTARSSYSVSGDSIPKSAMQQVWRGTVRLMPSEQKYEYTIFFDTAFVYTGNNIVMAVEKPANSGSYATCVSFYGHYTTEKRALNSAGYVENVRNSIIFCISPSCPKPQQVRYTSLSRHAVRLDWNAGDSHGWNVEYGPQGFAQGTGTTLHTDTSSVTVTHLVFGYYDFYVQADCGATEQSLWTKCRVLVTVSSDGTETLSCGTIDKFYTQTSDSITCAGSTTSTIFPMGHYYDSKYTYTQQLYTARDFRAVGIDSYSQIVSLSFQYDGTAQVKSPVEVYLGNVSLSELNDWVSPSQLQQVYTGAVALANGWVTINFNVPFIYAGESVVVAMLNNSGTDNGTSIFDMHCTNRLMALERTSTAPIDMENSYYFSGDYVRNNIQFCTDSSVRVLSRDTTVYITDGASYDFYGTDLSRQGVYTHRWVVDDNCDSLVTLTLKVRKIFYVTTTGAGLRDGSSWQNATDLQTALDTANTFTDVIPCIYVKRGTYPGNVTSKNSFVIKPNAQVYGGFAGNEPADFNLDNRDIVGNPTVLFGSNARRVLCQEAYFASGKETVIDGFTIRGGTINDSISSGGAVYMRKGCTLSNCNIMATNASVASITYDIQGVAVYNVGGTLKDCTIKNNRINVSGTASRSRGINGIGLFNVGGTVQGCIIQNNTVVYEGSNDVTPSNGGGLYCGNGTTVLDCQITQNSANDGGGLYAARYATIVVKGCTVCNNVARTSGGGVYVYGYTKMSNCHIGNNVSGSNGGGVYAGQNVDMVNCNVVRNTAASNGGGLYIYRCNVNAYNTIVWGNKVGNNDNQIYGTAGFRAQGCAVHGGCSGAITLNAENDGAGFGYPRFAAPTAEAGTDVNNAIGDWSLSAGSACINAGTNSAVTDDVDLQGNARIQQERVDVGAFESAHLPQGLTPQVQSNIIYVTPAGAGLQDGSSWGNATSNLTYAMETAAGCEPAAKVWVAQGIYQLSGFLQPGVAVYGGFAGNEPTSYNLAQRDFTQHASVIDTAGSVVLLAQSYPFEEATRGVLDGFTLRNGGSVSSYWLDEGVSSVTLLGKMTMKNVLFTDNYHNSATDCDFLYCTFRQNKRNGINANNCRLKDCLFEGNAWNGVNATNASALSNCMAQNNGTAGSGSDYAGFSLANSSKMSECVSSNNNGNGIYSNSSTVLNATVANNNGGGVYASGGLFYNVNVANNSKQQRGAGIYATSSAKFINCNVVNNKSLTTNYSGGVYGTDGCEFTNCIVWGNKNNSDAGNIEGGGTYSYCAVEGGCEGTANISLAASNTGSGTNHVRFSAPTDSAGVSSQQNRDWRLSAGSVCINAGNAVNTSLNLPEVDLAGSLRVKQQRIDIGAYEYGDITYQTVNDTICLGSDFFFGDYYVYPETAGLFVDTFTYYENGMDYVANISLMVGEVYQHNLTDSICEGDTYTFHGRQLTQTGVYEAFLRSAEGCDSTVTLQLTVLPKSYNTLTETACEQYIWNGVTYDAGGDYVQTLTASNGCDSVVTLHLTINHHVTNEWHHTACERYTWNGITYNASGDYEQTLTAANGCDSVVTLHLTVTSTVRTEWYHTACEHYTWNGQTYHGSGDYVQTLTAANGCDSVVTLHLTINRTVIHEWYHTACEQYTWNGVSYNVSGDYVQTLPAANGCDSIVTLHLTINRNVANEWSHTACEHYTWNGVTYDAGGDYVQTLTASNGCDSIVTLHLTINRHVTNEWSHATCGESFIWNGITYDTTGDYVQTLPAANGCDSVVTLHLTIVPDTVPQVLVSGQIISCVGGTATLSLTAPYSNYVWSTGDTSATLNVTSAGYYWVTVTDSYGCETVSSPLQLGESALIEGTPSICMVGIENGHNLLIWAEMGDTDVQYYKIYRENDRANVFEPLAVVASSEANVFEDTTSDPTMRAYRYKITAMDVCQSETPLSELHKTVHLTINRGVGNSWNLIWTPYEGTEIVSCKLYRGTTPYNMQQIATMPATLTSYTDYTNQNGALFYQIEMVLEGSCVRRTRDVSYAGARSNVVHNGMPVQTEQTLAVCDSLVWNGATLTASGDYVDTVTVNNAYDSITTLHLTVNASAYAVLGDTVCSGSDYAAYGFEWIRPAVGIHRDTLRLNSAAGCDSTVCFTLTVLDLPEVSISGNLDVQQGESTVLSASGASTYLWSTGETASAVTVAPTETTAYSVTGTDGYGCSNADTAVVTVNVGIADQYGPQVRLWPNPADKVVFVECQALQRVEIFTAMGQLMMAGTCPDADNATLQVNTVQYPDGVYFVRVTDAKGRQSTRTMVVAH